MFILHLCDVFLHHPHMQPVWWPYSLPGSPGLGVLDLVFLWLLLLPSLPCFAGFSVLYSLPDSPAISPRSLDIFLFLVTHHLVLPGEHWKVVGEAFGPPLPPSSHEHPALSNTMLIWPQCSTWSAVVFDITNTNKEKTKKIFFFLNILSGAQVLVTVTVAVAVAGAGRYRILLA